MFLQLCTAETLVYSCSHADANRSYIIKIYTTVSKWETYLTSSIRIAKLFSNEQLAFYIVTLAL